MEAWAGISAKGGSAFFKKSGGGEPSLQQVRLLLPKAWAGIEPANKGFADLCLPTWLPGLGQK